MAISKQQQFAATVSEVSMKTNPTLLVDIAMKLGIERPGNDKEKLVKKVNAKLAYYKKQNEALERAGYKVV